MFFYNSDYLTKLFDFSQDLEGVEMSFIDKDIEAFYMKESNRD